MECFESAIALDPGNAEALAWLGATHCNIWLESFAEEHAAKGVSFSAKAIEIDPFNAKGHAFHTWALLCIGNLEAALEFSKRAVALNSGDPAVLVNRTLALIYDGKSAEAQKLLELGRKLEPLPLAWFNEIGSLMAFIEGRYAEALEGFEPLGDFAWDIMYALSSCGHLGLADRAKAILSRFQKLGPEPDWFLGASRDPFRDRSLNDRLVAGLNRAFAY